MKFNILALLALMTATPAMGQTVAANNIVTNGTQILTIDAIGNGNVRIMDNTQVQGSFSASGFISTSQMIRTTGTGSIESAYNLSAAGNKFNVAGDTGRVRANGIDNTGKKITGVANGTNTGDAVNYGQLSATNDALALEKSERISGDASNAAGLAAEMIARADGDAANANAIASEVTARTNTDAVLSSRIDAEIDARIAGDKANAAQTATAQAKSIKIARQSGALAMAVAGMTGATSTDYGNTDISMGIGTFGGETAVAVGVSHTVSNAIRIFGAVTKVDGGDTGGAIGGSYSF
jgi:hypothetical protein